MDMTKLTRFLANIFNFPVVPVHQSLLSILGKILFFVYIVNVYCIPTTRDSLLLPNFGTRNDD